VSLPAPNLDDRRFQQLVDEAKRLVQQRCPEWTDHNVSDPGVTLIESFAYIADLLLYRFNRVPDRHYVKFLDLIGVQLFPPVPARAAVTFWLSAPQPSAVRVPHGAQVATVRTESEEAVVFTVDEDLDIGPCERGPVLSSVASGQFRAHAMALDAGIAFTCFDDVPKANDALYVGLSDPTPRCAVLLRFDCSIEGVGVDPRNPPLVWEAWTSAGWVACELDHDDTGGLNRAGDVVVHVPVGHVASVLEGQRAGWLRCRVIEADDGRPRYSRSPLVRRIEAHTVGGTTSAVHAEPAGGDVFGVSDGVPAQRFTLATAPVVPSLDDLVVEVGDGNGWRTWRRVDHHAQAAAADEVFTLEASSGTIAFGPAVRQPDGSVVGYGAVPPKGAMLRVGRYFSGGGARGNVTAGSLSVLKNAIPFVGRVENCRAAAGGVDGERVEEAKVRGPVELRTRSRAVTAEDYERLARQAAPELARVRCLPAVDDPGLVRVLVVPAVAGERGRLAFEQLVPAPDTVERVGRLLDERRCIGARVVVEPPLYQGLTVVARLRARPRFDADLLREEALDALYGWFHPVSSGPDGEGWPFGRPVQVGEVYACLGHAAEAGHRDARTFPQ